MKKNHLKFSESGDRFQIIFKEGGESDFITSKQEGFSSIKDLAEKKKITIGEFGEMRDQILAKEELPWSESKGRRVEVSVVRVGGLGDLLGSLIMSDLFSDLLDKKHEPSEPKKPTEIAYLKMCECPISSFIPHSRILFKTGYVGPFLNKEEALKALNVLKKEKSVDEDEYKKVKLEIQESALVSTKDKK